MKVAFIPYANDPSGIPDGWPATAPRTIGNDEPLLDGEIELSESEYAERMAALAPVKEAWNATRKDQGPGKVWDRVDFRALFTEQEWGDFKAAVKVGNPYAEGVWEELLLVTKIEQRNPRTAEALGALAAIGVIAPGRITEILA